MISSEDAETVIFWLYMINPHCDLDREDSNPFFSAWHSSPWWWTTIPGLVTKGWPVQKISSGQSRTHGQTHTWRFQYIPLTLLQQGGRKKETNHYGGQAVRSRNQSGHNATAQERNTVSGHATDSCTAWANTTEKDYVWCLCPFHVFIQITLQPAKGDNGQCLTSKASLHSPKQSDGAAKLTVSTLVSTELGLSAFSGVYVCIELPSQISRNQAINSQVFWSQLS